MSEVKESSLTWADTKQHYKTIYDAVEGVRTALDNWEFAEAYNALTQWEIFVVVFEELHKQEMVEADQALWGLIEGFGADYHHDGFEWNRWDGEDWVTCDKSERRELRFRAQRIVRLFRERMLMLSALMKRKSMLGRESYGAASESGVTVDMVLRSQAYGTKIVAPLTRLPYDPYYPVVIEAAYQRCNRNNDDILLFFVGETGTGKTSLGLHGYELYSGGVMSVDFVSLTQDDYVRGLERVKSMAKPRFIQYDEAKASRRKAMSSWIVDLIETQNTIRGLNICQFWCYPSLEWFDKNFVEEKLHGAFVVYTKDVGKPRKYYYYTKKGLVRLLESKGNLKRETLIDNGSQYSLYQGWFRDYTGELREPYLEKKKAKMEETVEDFSEKYKKKDLQPDTYWLERFPLGKATFYRRKRILGYKGRIGHDQFVNIVNFGDTDEK